MTLIELAELFQFFGSILIYLLAFILFIIALVGASKKGFTLQRVALAILALGAVFTMYLAYNVREIAPADWAQILLMLGLVAVTGFYALSASRQANASVKMAEEMREQTKTLRETVSMSVRPSLSIDITRVSGGNTYPFEPPTNFSVRIENKGKGPARNLVVTGEAQNKKVEYSKMEFPSLNVGDKKEFSIHRVTDVSTNEVRVAYVILKAIYNDELGEGWFVTLEIDKDGKSWKPGELICDRLFVEKRS